MLMLSETYINEYNNNNKSGKMSVEKYIIKNYTKDYEIIIEYCVKNNLEHLPFKQKVYHVVNNIPKAVICKNPNCENTVNFKNSTIGYYEYCSNKCIGSDPSMIKRKEEISLKKYGTKTPAESNIIKNKMLKTNNDRYGSNSPMSNIEIQEKSKKTLLKNWGVDNPSKSDEILKKRVNSFKANVDKWKESYKKTSLDKYGVEHPWMDEEIHKKTFEKFYKKYEIRIKEKLLNSSYNDTFIEFNFNDEKKIKLECAKCKEKYSIKNYNFYFRTNNDYEICTKCNPVGSNFNISNMELQLLNFIKNNYNGEIILNSRDIISPYEIDIYLPEINLAIEFNGLYWHSEFNKDKGYHYSKSMLCGENNIQLIHIWEDDWVYKNDIIKSMLLNKLDKSIKIYARKCKIKEVSDSKLVREFLDRNHIQGYSTSSYKIGLYYNDELVSLMTFSKPRKMMGQKAIEGEYELSRFCNKLNHSVVGGASKLFKYFLDNYNPKKVTSFSDISYSEGKLYDKLGFDYIEQNIKLNYYWVLDKKRYHRYNFRKQNLIKMGYDSNKSEDEIMYEDLGAFRIWGTGHKKWVYINH
jgi:hypothetical protein